MPYRTTYWIGAYGIGFWNNQPQAYCVNDTSASDYGKCYNIDLGRAIFVQTNTSSYPTLACQNDGTCNRYTTIPQGGNLIPDILVDLTSVNKQLMLLEFRSVSQGSSVNRTPEFLESVIWVFTDNIWTPYPITLLSYDLNNPTYGPYFKLHVNRYSPPPYAKNVIDVWAWPRILGQKLAVGIYWPFDNSWLAGYVRVYYSYEASPLAIIPLNYSEYITYADIRSAFGYNASGFDQPGWNADDMIRALKEVFPDRTWAVFDDRTNTLYLYGLTMDDAISLGFVQRLSPTTVKVLDQNKKSDYTRFKEFYTKQISG